MFPTTLILGYYAVAHGYTAVVQVKGSPFHESRWDYDEDLSTYPLREYDIGLSQKWTSFNDLSEVVSQCESMKLIPPITSMLL